MAFAGTDASFDLVQPINQKRLLAFVNHWITINIDFLNKFAESMETKLIEINRRLIRVENALYLLEAKLDSISGLKSNEEGVIIKSNDDQANLANPIINDDSITQVGEIARDSVEDTSVKTSYSDPRLEIYFKMLRMGVQSMAVRQKMTADGFDPSFLDHPLPAPAPIEIHSPYSSASSSSSSVSFRNDAEP